MEECLAAVKGTTKNKAPGLDRFPADFYYRFWGVFGQDLATVLNHCFLSGSRTLSQHRGIITLSFKKGDCLDPRNWRTLLNVDYKIASRAIAGGLLKVIHLVVNKDQTCGVPGRYIGENVSLTRDVVHYTMSTGFPAAILSLGQEKVFDRVDWGFMKATLCHRLWPLIHRVGESFLSSCAEFCKCQWVSLSLFLSVAGCLTGLPPVPPPLCSCI